MVYTTTKSYLRRWALTVLAILTLFLIIIGKLNPCFWQNSPLVQATKLKAIEFQTLHHVSHLNHKLNDTHDLSRNKTQPCRNITRKEESPWGQEVVKAYTALFANREWNWDYHKRYPVNCTAIFEGDEDAIRDSGLLLSLDGRKLKMLPVPSEERVIRWFQNCTAFKHNRGYPLHPLSKEEESFPIAYSIVTYKDAAQVERLLRSIYQPQNVYCIHTDNSSSTAFKTAVQKLAGCFDNVFIASKLENVKWGSFSAVLADLNCMKDLLHHPVPWKYALNLCGMDFPLKTNLEMVRQLRAYNGHNCIESYNDTRTYNRTRYSNATGELKGPAPHNITVYKGDTYIAATRRFVDFFVNSQIANDHLDWLSDTKVPDEYFTSSLNKLPYAPGGSPYLGIDCNVRFRKWDHKFKFKERPKCRGIWVHGLCIYTAGYIQYFHRAPQLFVNKVHYEYDPIAMQCIEDMLDYRTAHPEDFAEWKHYNFPVTNYSWLTYDSETYVPGLSAIELEPWKDLT